VSTYRKFLIAVFIFTSTAFGQTVLAPMPRQCFNDSLSPGKPLAGGKIFTYQAGTSTPQTTFTDSSGSIANSNPIILDAAGCWSIWLTSGQAYRFVAQNSAGAQEWVQDQVTGLATTNPATATPIYAMPGESVAHAATRLPSGGGKIIFDCGTYPSGNVIITTPNIWLQGCGMPNYNSTIAPTALAGGTIIQGSVIAYQGADGFRVQDLGIDTGSAWVNANNGGTPVEGLAIFNNGQIVGAPQVKNPIFQNVACLGYSAAAAVHCMIMENVSNALMQNVQSVYDFHGIAIKGTNSTLDGVICRGHGGDCIIAKSDDYAPSSGLHISHFTARYLSTPGDTKGIILQGIAAGMNDINLSDGNIIGVASFALQAQGASISAPFVGLNVDNVTVDYTTPSPSNYYCFQYIQYVELVSLNNFNCSNYWFGINPNLPQSGFTNEFNLSNSHFVNIGTTAIETYGRWNVTNTSIISAATGLLVDTNSAVNWCNSYFATVTTPYNSSGTIVGCALPVTSFTTTAAATDNVAVSGMTSAGHCQLTPTNSGAAGGIASVYVSAKTANQITVTHTATAGWNFDVACTPN
jgi:hypothetical protein